MKTVHIVLLTTLAVVLAAGVPAIGQEDHSAASLPPGGALRTMPHGNYQCALPGDAGSAPFVVVEEQNFRISTASRYQTGEGSGTYIMRGRELLFTRGPRKGEQFRQIGDNQLRKLDAAGEDTDLLCTRLGSR